MKYRIKIWLDEYEYRSIDNMDFHFSCEPPAEKYSRYEAVSIISEKMREFSMKKNPKERVDIYISEYDTGDPVAANYVFFNIKENDWTFDYRRPAGDWITEEIPQ